MLNLAGERLELTQLLAQQKSGKGEIEVLDRQAFTASDSNTVDSAPSPPGSRRPPTSKSQGQCTSSWTQCHASVPQTAGSALFITNIPQSMLHTEHVATLYRLRWQIELVFKMCKSYCALDFIASFRSQRILMKLDACLIGSGFNLFPFGACSSSRWVASES